MQRHWAIHRQTQFVVARSNNKKKNNDCNNKKRLPKTRAWLPSWACCLDGQWCAEKRRHNPPAVTAVIVALRWCVVSRLVFVFFFFCIHIFVPLRFVVFVLFSVWKAAKVCTLSSGFCVSPQVKIVSFLFVVVACYYCFNFFKMSLPISLYFLLKETKTLIILFLSLSFVIRLRDQMS